MQVETEVIGSELRVRECEVQEFTLRDSMRSSNRKLKWENICCELIDNALEHADGTCGITLSWNQSRRVEYFRAVDNGVGAEDIKVFFNPGQSAQTGRSLGNSTFGMGLFVLECFLAEFGDRYRYMVASRMEGGRVRVGYRSIQKSMQWFESSYGAENEDQHKNELGNSGTSVTFHQYARSKPSIKSIGGIQWNLSREYGRAILSGALSITLVRDGVEYPVLAEPIPDCEELKRASVVIEGHDFCVEWGVTKGPSRDNGCRLVYGGKFFDSTQAPCGEHRIGRFYACISIPRTIGKDAMDILKRTVDHECLDELFAQCEEMFAEELKRSDEICAGIDDASQSSYISGLLSSAIRTPVKNNPSDVKPSDDTDDAVKRYRDFFVRNNENKGVEPQGTGKTRNAKLKKKVPEKINPYWSNLGEAAGCVLYDHSGRRVTFNLDVPMVANLQKKKGDFILATMAAAQIAKDISGTEKQKELGFGDMEFEWIYRTMMERIFPLSEA